MPSWLASGSAGSTRSVPLVMLLVSTTDSGLRRLLDVIISALVDGSVPGEAACNVTVPRFCVPFGFRSTLPVKRMVLAGTGLAVLHAPPPIAVQETKDAAVPLQLRSTLQEPRPSAGITACTATW